jgi:hypothetical protein
VPSDSFTNSISAPLPIFRPRALRMDQVVEVHIESFSMQHIESWVIPQKHHMLCIIQSVCHSPALEFLIERDETESQWPYNRFTGKVAGIPKASRPLSDMPTSQASAAA